MPNDRLRLRTQDNNLTRNTNFARTANDNSNSGRPNGYANLQGRDRVEAMKQDFRQAQDGDPAAMQRLEELSKQNKELFKKFQELMGGGGNNVDPTDGPQPNPDPNDGPQPAPNPGPAPDPGGGGGGGGGGCNGCGGGGGAGAAGQGGAGGGIMDFLMMLLQMIAQAKQGGDQGDQGAGDAAGGPAGGGGAGAGGAGEGGLDAGQAQGVMGQLAGIVGMDPAQLEQMFQQNPEQAVQMIAQAAQQQGIDLQGQLGGLVSGM